VTATSQNVCRGDGFHLEPAHLNGFAVVVVVNYTCCDARMSAMKKVVFKRPLL